jgi:hypothetical protein
MPDDSASDERTFGVPELTDNVLETYARLWQFETWLRRLVYVQLRSLDGDAWETKIETAKTKTPKKHDKDLTHMPTSEDDVLSFVQLSELKRIVADHWNLFASYLPPQSIWDAKLTEVMASRHRVAHFRSLHRDDLARVKQFLRDIDNGFWRICTSYNAPSPVLPQSEDPVVEHFLDYDLLPWCKTHDGKWARVGVVDPSERVTMTIEVLTMPWAKWVTPIAGTPGFLYDVLIYARGRWHHDFTRLLQSTRHVHQHMVHICLADGGKSFRFTLPACLGADKINEIIAILHNAAMNTLATGLDAIPDSTAQALADTYPEYVLGPHNPLTFLGPDMPCSFFGI